MSDAIAQHIQQQFQPVFDDIRERATVADRFLDRNLYSVYCATLWANMALSPEEVGLEEDQLPILHDVLLQEMSDAIGPQDSMHDLFRFIASKNGERAMQEARLTQAHKDLLLYFASMILDPDGHKRYLEHVRKQQKR